MTSPPMPPRGKRKLPKSKRELADRIVSHIRYADSAAADVGGALWEGLAIADVERALGEHRLGGVFARLVEEGALVKTRHTWPGTSRARDLYRLASPPPANP